MIRSSGYESSSGFSVRSYRGVDILQMLGKYSVNARWWLSCGSSILGLNRSGIGVI
jgi:hypothetical protein